MRADQRSPVIRQLRNFKGTNFCITLRDKTTKDVVLSSKANRWELLLNILEKLPWECIEARDSDGKTLGLVEAEEDASDDQDDEEDEYEADPLDRLCAATERMAKVIMGVVVATQQETRKSFEPAMRTLTEGFGVMQDASTTARESYLTAMKIRDIAAMEGGGGSDAGSGEKIMQMMTMAMAMMNGQKAAPPLTINVPPARPAPMRPKSAPTNGVDVKG